MNNPAIYEKYKERIIFEYDLKQFSIYGYSKGAKILQADFENGREYYRHLFLSQYRRKLR